MGAPFAFAPAARVGLPVLSLPRRQTNRRLSVDGGVEASEKRHRDGCGSVCGGAWAVQRSSLPCGYILLVPGRERLLNATSRRYHDPDGEENIARRPSGDEPKTARRRSGVPPLALP